MTGDIVGVVLAGGRGRRMGGGDKGLLMLGGVSLVSVAVRRLQRQTCGVIINANRNIGEYEKLGCPVVADALPEDDGGNFGAGGNCQSENQRRGKNDKSGGGDNHCGFAGPLAGMLAGMRAARAMDKEWVLFVPCDCPFFPATLASALSAGIKKHNADIAVAVADGREQPVFMLVRRELAADLAAFVGGGGRKIDLWYRRHSFAKVLFDDGAAFVNINTPEELAAAHKRLSAIGEVGE